MGLELAAPSGTGGFSREGLEGLLQRMEMEGRVEELEMPPGGGARRCGISQSRLRRPGRKGAGSLRGGLDQSPRVGRRTDPSARTGDFGWRMRDMRSGMVPGSLPVCPGPPAKARACQVTAGRSRKTDTLEDLVCL